MRGRVGALVGFIGAGKGGGLGVAAVSVACDGSRGGPVRRDWIADPVGVVGVGPARRVEGGLLAFVVTGVTEGGVIVTTLTGVWTISHSVSRNYLREVVFKSC